MYFENLAVWLTGGFVYASAGYFDGLFRRGEKFNWTSYATSLGIAFGYAFLGPIIDLPFSDMAIGEISSYPISVGMTFIVKKGIGFLVSLFKGLLD